MRGATAATEGYGATVAPRSGTPVLVGWLGYSLAPATSRTASSTLLRRWERCSPADRMVEMSDAKPVLKTLEEIERTCVPGLVEVLRTEGIDGVRYALWDMTGWHRDYDPCVWRSRAT